MMESRESQLLNVRLVNPYRRGVICWEKNPAYMTEDEGLANCPACLSAWQHRDRIKHTRRIGVGRPTE